MAVFTSTDSASPQPGDRVNAKLRRFRTVFALASQAAGTDQLRLPVLPAGFVFAYGVLTSTVSLGSAQIAIGASATHASNGKYRAAGVFTVVDTPTLFGAAAAVGGAPLTADEQPWMTWAAAALPSSGTLIIDLYGSTAA
jgi:hypothetical protein